MTKTKSLRISSKYELTHGDKIVYKVLKRSFTMYLGFYNKDYSRYIYYHAHQGSFHNGAGDSYADIFQPIENGDYIMFELKEGALGIHIRKPDGTEYHK